MTTTSADRGPGPGATRNRWLHNPATGEIARFDLSDAAGRRMEIDLWLQPGAAVARPHVHDHFVERFQVLDGALGVEVGGAERRVAAGEPVVEVPAGRPHDWWNAADGVSRVRIEVAATPQAPGRPAERFLSMLEAVWSLGALGHVDDGGAPHTLWLMALAHEYRDVLRLVTPPRAVQAVLIPPMAALARRSGRDPRAAELHGPTGASTIADPGEDGLAALLATPVGTRAARGH